MSTETRLKPCPFCGGAAKEFERLNANVITCRRCGVKVRQSEMGEGDAAERWNQRATPVAAQPDVTQQTLDDVMAGIPARDAEIEALRKEIDSLRAQPPVSGADQFRDAAQMIEPSGNSGELPRLPLNDPAAAYRVLHEYGQSCARAALAQRDADKVDAERYRYLRSVGGRSWTGYAVGENPKKHYGHRVIGCEYDVAVDAARKEQA